MTRDELIEAIRGRLKARDRDDYDAGFRAGIEAAAELAEQLDSPPAMAWQDEPSELGWYWVDGFDICPCHVSMAFGRWFFARCDGAQPLDGRRVCPIQAPPVLTKRGA